jgi:hypothetical protein
MADNLLSLLCEEVSAFVFLGNWKLQSSDENMKKSVGWREKRAGLGAAACSCFCFVMVALWPG